MSRSTRCLKIVMFRDQFPEVSDTEINGFVEVSGFIVSIYAKFWFDSDKADKAAFNDLQFLRKMEEYKGVNKNIAEKGISKMLNHLYYLSEESVGLCLSDERIDNETKWKLVAKMSSYTLDSEDEDEVIPKKLALKNENLAIFISRDYSIVLQELFSKNTSKVFKRFGISTTFLNSHPQCWNDLEEFQRGKNIVQNIHVANDSAERGIKLIQEYHGKITKDEAQKQDLMKVVQSYRQQYSASANLKYLRKEFE